MILGDSIAAQKLWQDRLIQYMHPRHVDSFAVGGARWRDSIETILNGDPQSGNETNNVLANQVQKIINNIDDYNIPDVIIIHAGVNDSYGSTPYAINDIDQYFVTGSTSSERTYIPLEDMDRKQFPAAIRWTVETLWNYIRLHR